MTVLALALLTVAAVVSFGWEAHRRSAYREHRRDRQRAIRLAKRRRERRW